MRMSGLIVAAMLVSQSYAQDTLDISPYLERIQGGDTESIREEISDLAERRPEDPGVRYLQGLVTEDGTDAVRIFQGLVDRHPGSEWADDALYRVYQFYYSIGLYRTADLKWAQLQKDYPGSPYLSKAKGAGKTEEGPGPVAPEEKQATEAVAAVPRGENQNGQFALQVGAYSARENAEKQKLFFEDQGYPVEVINRVRDARSLFLVLVGNFLTYDDAKSRIEDIRKKYGVESFVVSR
jgi:hypothetical protein